MNVALSRVALVLGLLVMAGPSWANGTTNGHGSNFLSRIAVGFEWSCAINDTDEVVCWYGSNGQPEPAGVSEARQVSVGLQSACAVTRLGEVYCWNHGETPQKISYFGGGLESYAVSVLVDTPPASGPATCAVVSSGSVYCWGDNDEGQLGDGTTTDRDAPVKVKGVAGVVSLFSGSSRTGTVKCGIRITGGVRCWGNGVSTPYAITNMDGVREIAITMDGTCVWRRIESWSNVSCTDTHVDSLKNSANFVSMDGLFYPQALTSNLYGDVCIADAGQTYSWNCAALSFGHDQTPRAGFMTTLQGHDALTFGDMQHSCASAADGSVRCMNHGMMNGVCDLATRGAACNTAPSNRAPGTWSLVPNLLLAQGGKPYMFGNSSDHRMDSCTSTSVTVSWKAPAETTQHYAKVCDQYMSCRVISSAVKKVGDRYTLTATNLKRNSRYMVFADPSNWASYQGGFGIETRTSP